MSKILDCTIIGGGMITNDLILPSIYHLQRTGIVRDVHICALNNPPLKALKENKSILEAFPGQHFIPHPLFNENPERNFPDLYKEVLAGMKPRQAVVVAMPDQLHYQVIMEALKANQHVLSVKPLVLHYNQAAAFFPCPNDEKNEHRLLLFQQVFSFLIEKKMFPYT